MPSSATVIPSRKAPHTMLGHCHPSDHKRKFESESWRVGITAVSPLVCYRPFVTYSFVPYSLARPYHSAYIRSFSPLTAPIRSGPGSTTPTQAPLRLSYRLSKVHQGPQDPATCIPSCIEPRRNYRHALILLTNSTSYRVP
ncbi:hypothetical protein K443DRAFT_349686 [Laccaria amethystina LaAM-08-1]|uniref:Uncharacterized protein n=1 Tax=Laccaria amethystina LaAM-08-1 TaxID=1095629 RepID=A0A0C9X0D3_9AGAR|nr:hypothetical protein K443DRAFT_349686 [Laccaria amethystina LaAM-08-1]